MRHGRNLYSYSETTFWANGAKIWFQQTKSQFSICNISAEQTKYDHVVAALPGEIAVKLKDVCENVPEVDQYKVPKNHLLQKFSLTVFAGDFSSETDFSCNAFQRLFRKKLP